MKNFSITPVKVVGTAKSLEEGIKVIKATKPDVVFLDIDMPSESGLDIYKHIKKPEFKIIFVTAYQQYAISALKNSATDYLLKPVNFIELRESIAKVVTLIEQEQQQKELEDKISLMCAADMDGKNVVLDIETGFVVENTKNIEYCYADHSYSVIVNYSGKKLVVTRPLKVLQELLPSNQFYRTHKSYLVNIHYIRKFVRANESHVILKSGIKIPVSVRACTEITKAIKQMFDN